MYAVLLVVESILRKISREMEFMNWYTWCMNNTESKNMILEGLITVGYVNY